MSSYVLVYSRYYAEVQSDCETLEAAIALAQYIDDHGEGWPIEVRLGANIALDYQALHSAMHGEKHGAWVATNLPVKKYV